MDKKIKVGFDISQIAHPGGVSKYTQNLADNLVMDNQLQMKFFYSSLRKPYKGGLKDVSSYRIPPSVFEVMFNTLRFPSIETFIGDVDVFHSSDWVQPKSRAKKVTTYHDLVPLRFPQWSHTKIVETHRKRLEIVKKEVDMIISVSEATKKDLLEIGGVDPNIVVVIYEGVSSIYKPLPKEEIEVFRKQMGLPDVFVLAIGGIGSRRNIDRVKEACKGYNLIITGESIPYIPEEKMPYLYQAAAVLLYPSFYEGFGLPVLEAMACGVPVITANTGALPEVGGFTVEYVFPEDVEEMKRKLNIVVRDPQRRKQMISGGLTQAGKFSWQNCSKQTIEVYKKVLSS